MDRQKENIDLLIRKAFTLGFFLFVLLVFKSSDCSVVDSFNRSVTIEKASEIDYSALLVEPLAFTCFDNSLVSCEIFTFNNGNSKNYKIICSNNKMNLLLLLSKKRFIDIKTHLFDINSRQVRASLNSEKIPLIS